MSEDQEFQAVSSFSTYCDEASLQTKHGEYLQAVESYTRALELRPGDLNVLVARSRCHLMLANPKESLNDAEEALKIQPTLFKAVFRKAEALYSKGDFEMALVFYHRGKSMKPESHLFRLGIQKAGEAIENSIGHPEIYKLKPPPGVKLMAKTRTRLQSPRQGLESTTSLVWQKEGISQAHSARKQSSNQKYSKQLLGELYEDKQYLDSLLKGKHQENIKSLVNTALLYLNSRTEFWSQQQPVYSRMKDKNTEREIDMKIKKAIAKIGEEHHLRTAAALERKNNPKSAGGARSNLFNLNSEQRPQTAPPALIKIEIKTGQFGKVTNETFDAINILISNGEFDSAVRRAKQLATRLIASKPFDGRDLSLCQTYHILGMVHGLAGKTADSLASFKAELQTAKDSKSFYEDIGLVVRDSTEEIIKLHVKSKRYKSAIFALKSLVKDTEKSPRLACIHHDLGRCYFELKEYGAGMKYANESMELADDCGYSLWSLSSRVLLAQIQIKMNQSVKARTTFREAHEFALELKNTDTAKTIQLIMNQIDASI